MTSMEKIVPYLDEIMSLFYKDMLSHEQMAVFFADDAAVERLIGKQKANFIDSLNDTPEQLQERYVRLGEFHYNLRVPSADFLKSTKIWRGCFINYAINIIEDTGLVQVVENYFQNVDSWMSKGYLEKQLAVDKLDLERLIDEYKNNDVPSSDMALKHLNWLYQILLAVQEKDITLAPELDVEKCTSHVGMDSENPESFSVYSKDYLDDMHRRLHINAQSLFFFITIDDYLEVLALYSNLLTVYKITLVAIGNIDLQQKIRELKDTLSEAKKEIKYLRGIIPICSYCHSIRNDEGAWNRLEEYISEHSDAVFSHGICPDCYGKIKADIVIENPE